MNKESVKFWVPIFVPIMTSLMVFYMGVGLKKDQEKDKQLLLDIKEIKNTINRTSVVFGKLEVKIANLEKRVDKAEQKLDK